jgi:RNA recognition motif-containing protein
VIFSEYGNILAINIKTSNKRKGQAFVVYDNVESATKAIEEVQGFEIFGKPMVLEYARTPSDAFVQATGSEKDFELHKRARVAQKGVITRYPKTRANDRIQR